MRVGVAVKRVGSFLRIGSFGSLVLFAAEAARAGDDRADAPHTERGLAAAVGGDTDVGIGLVGLGALTRMKPHVAPYVWRIEAGMFTTFKMPTHDAPLRFPYEDYFVLLTIPHFF